MNKRNFDPLRCGAVFGAIVITLLRMSPTKTDVITFLAHAFSSRGSLSQDPYVQILAHAPYSFASSGLAHLFAWISMQRIASAERSVAILAILLWAIQAWAMFDLSEAVTGNRYAAALATLFYGMEIAFVLGDGPYATALLERSLCMAPYLWGLQALFQGKRWRALVLNAMSTYLHATPAIYLWPLLFVEDWLEALRKPHLRRSALLRTAGAVALGMPLLFLVGHDSLYTLPPGFMRLGMTLQGNVMAGIGHILPDKLFILEGFVLMVLAAWRWRRLPSAPLLRHIFICCLGFMLLGSVSYWGYMHGLEFCLIPLRMQPWVSPCILELFGSILMSLWIVSEFSDSPWIWPAWLLLFVMPQTLGHDFILRGIVALLGVCLLLGKKSEAIGIIVATALLSWTNWLMPGAILNAIQHLGLRGGFLHLPAFLPGTGVILLGCLGFSLWLTRQKRQIRGLSVPIAAAAGIMVLAVVNVQVSEGKVGFVSETSSETEDQRRMAVWIRDNTPPSASILLSPITLGGTIQEFMTISERSIFASHVNLYPARFGNMFAPMAERVRDLGFDPSLVVHPADLDAEVARADAQLTPALAGRIEEKYGTTLLLVHADRSWPGKPLHREGNLVLYPLLPPAKKR